MKLFIYEIVRFIKSKSGFMLLMINLS